ncbi:MAG: hypothetical protein AB7V55_05050 [Oscillospiraceae bacterium]
MSAPLMLVANAVNLRGLWLALPLVALVLLVGWLVARTRKKSRVRPGHFMEYEAHGHSAVECRLLLEQKDEADLFDYTLEAAPHAGRVLHLTGHRPTGQPLDTVYLIQFEDGPSARFTLRFVREAFANPDPLPPEALLDAFFAAKLDAGRVSANDGLV